MVDDLLMISSFRLGRRLRQHRSSDSSSDDGSGEGGGGEGGGGAKCSANHSGVDE